ncbi:MAG: tetratricopeptide repeat protein [Alistipes finegoldii]
MKRLTATTALCVLFCTAFAAGKGPAGVPGYPDSLRSVWLYTEGIKQNAIARDTVRAREFFAEAIRNDSTFAPAYYEMAANGMYSTPDEAVNLARTAFRLDTANKWYHQFLGQALIYARRYDEALAVYRRLRSDEPQNPDNYRILAALYEQAQQPFSAIATLDSAEVRFGRIPVLSAMKRQLLISTRQLDKAVDEAKAMVEAAPYEAQHHVVLADLYAILNKDSLAMAEYDRAMQIDSTDVATLMSLADYYNGRRDYRSVLNVTQRLFDSDQMPLDAKIKRFEQLTSDMRFYREYYIQLNALASTLAVRYPQDRRVVELYAKHLIASGELEQALALYKLHLDDQPPVESYYRSVIDIESYLQHPDSAALYINRALELFPERSTSSLERPRAELHQRVRQSDKSLSAVAPLRPHRFAARRDLGADRRHMAPESRGGESGDEEDFVLISRKGSFRSAMKQCYKAYDRSLRYDPDNAMVLNNYAYFLSLEERDLEKALAMASRATALTDNNPTYLDTHAWVLFKLGRVDEARKIMQQAVALDGQEVPRCWFHYGDILMPGRTVHGRNILAQGTRKGLRR